MKARFFFSRSATLATMALSIFPVISNAQASTQDEAIQPLDIQHSAAQQLYSQAEVRQLHREALEARREFNAALRSYLLSNPNLTYDQELRAQAAFLRANLEWRIDVEMAMDRAKNAARNQGTQPEDEAEAELALAVDQLRSNATTSEESLQAAAYERVVKEILKLEEEEQAPMPVE